MRANIDAGQQRQERRVQLAAEYLRDSEGCEVLATNWDGPDGRLPIVAVERSILVAVAVQDDDVPQSLPGSAEQQMRRMVVAWMTSHGVLFDRIRIDVISVRLDQLGHCLEHDRGDTR